MLANTSHDFISNHVSKNISCLILNLLFLLNTSFLIGSSYDVSTFVQTGSYCISTLYRQVHVMLSVCASKCMLLISAHVIKFCV